MKRHRASCLGLWLGLTLILGLGIVPVLVMAAETAYRRGLGRDS